MKWLIGIGAVVIIGVIFFMTDMFQFAKTVFLIARVTPYEQQGTTAGSIHFLGDSTGYGTGATAGKYSVAGRLGNEYPQYSIKNKSVNGRTITELLADTADFSGEYDLIVLQIGGNDILQKIPLDTVLTDLELLINRLSLHTKELVMLTSGNVGTVKRFSGAQAKEYEALSREYRTRVMELAAKTPNFTYVDLFDEPEDDEFVKNPDIYTSMDGLHPSNQGYGLWYEKSKDTFAEALQ